MLGFGHLCNWLYLNKRAFITAINIYHNYTLLLSKWKPIFAWLSVESIIHDRQQEYYEAINRSNDLGESTAFIEFMLSAIREALTEAMQTGETKADTRIQKILRFLRQNDYVTNADVRELLGVSAATANRILAKMVETEGLQKIRVGKSWGYKWWVTNAVLAQLVGERSTKRKAVPVLASQTKSKRLT